MRDFEGKLVAACSRGLANATNFIVELYALRDGLNLVKDKDLLPIIIEANSISTINALKNCDNFASISVSSLVKDCRKLLQILGIPHIRRIYRETNIVADYFAESVAHSSNALSIVDTPPQGACILMQYDLMDQTMPRLVNIQL